SQPDSLLLNTSRHWRCLYTTQKCLLDVIALKPTAQFAGGSGKVQAAVMHNCHAVTDLGDIRKCVRREKQGAALALKLFEARLEQCTRLRVESTRRFIQHIQVFTAQKTRGKPQLLRHALRVGPYGHPEGR